MFKDLNPISVFVLIVYPLTIITLAVLYALNNSLGWFELGLFFAGYYISTISVGVGLHRLWAHDTFKTNKFVEFVLMLLSAGTLQGPVLSWASNHFEHHTYTDTEKDPHTPLKYKSRVKGFWWSHMGWMLYGTGSYQSVNRVTMLKLGKNKLLRWQFKNYWQLGLLMNLLVPFMLGYAIGGNLTSACAGILFIGVGRALQQQTTFFVNSLCHFAGTHKYVSGTAGDVWWLAICLLGENWHNFHHAFPSDYRNGSRWYQFDVHKWIIYLLSKCGMAWDLKVTTEVRINAKMTQAAKALSKLQTEKLESLNKTINDLSVIHQETLEKLELSSVKAKIKLKKSFAKMQENIKTLKLQLDQQFKELKAPISDKVVSLITKKARKLESAMQKLCREFEQSNMQAA